MSDPLARVSTVATPQSRPIPGRAQVRNAAGGYVFAKDLWTQVEDFLILGTTGGTYYASADKLTEANVDVLFDAVTEDGPRLVSLITEISTARPPRAPKPRPALFALAAAAATGDPATVQAVKAAFPEVVRTTDHLATFFGYWKNLAGKAGADGRRPSPVIGRAMRTTLGSFFTADDIHQVAFRAVKARQRVTPSGEAMALRDIIRIAHPTGPTPAHRALIGWLAGKVSDEEARAALTDVDDYLTARAATTPGEAIAVIRDRRVPWEFLAPDVLADPGVWTELAQTVGLTALIRNLARMTRIGALAPFADVASVVAGRLADGDALARARVHPMDLYLAYKAYSSGRSQPAPRTPAQTWQPVGAISDALADAYELSFGAVEPSGRRLLVTVDSSGSMCGWAQVVSGGSPLGSGYEVANAVAAMLARIEGGNVHVIDVDTAVHASKVTPRTSLRELAGWRGSGGGTDLSLPFSWALARSLDVDGIIVLTDSETWAGRQHPVQALEAYRRLVNRHVRVVVVSMTATGMVVAEPAQAGVLNVAGLDASLPRVITAFLR
jgi:60 kDa SS-A/Ro ribonucleoprotein